MARGGNTTRQGETTPAGMNAVNVRMRLQILPRYAGCSENRFEYEMFGVGRDLQHGGSAGKAESRAWGGMKATWKQGTPSSSFSRAARQR